MSVYGITRPQWVKIFFFHIRMTCVIGNEDHLDFYEDRIFCLYPISGAWISNGIPIECVHLYRLHNYIPTKKDLITMPPLTLAGSNKAIKQEPKYWFATKTHWIYNSNQLSQGIYCIDVSCKTAVTALLMHWSYPSFALSHWFNLISLHAI